MSEQPPGPPEAEIETVAAQIYTGSVSYRFRINAEVVSEFTADVAKLLLNYKSHIRYLPSEPTQTSTGYGSTTRGKSTRAKGPFATMRDQLLEQIAVGNVDEEEADSLHIAERSRLSVAAQRVYWRLVDDGFIINPVPRPVTQKSAASSKK